MTIQAAELKNLYYQINRISNSDWQTKGKMIRSAFAKSVQYVEQVKPMRPDMADKLIEQISQCGDGWMCDNFQSLVIVGFDTDSLMRYARTWAEMYIRQTAK